MDIKDIQSFINFLVRSGAKEVSVETTDIKISVKNFINGDALPQQRIEQPLIEERIKPDLFKTSIIKMEKPNLTKTAPNAQTIGQENKTDVSSKKFYTIKSPMVGTFYRRPSPDQSDFIKVGDMLAKGTVVFIIEAMKLFNEIESEVSGKVIKILLDDASPAEFDQPLILIEQ